MGRLVPTMRPVEQGAPAYDGPRPTPVSKSPGPGTSVNFLTEDEGPGRIEAALGNGLERLAEVKAKWDPEALFPHKPEHRTGLSGSSAPGSLG